MTQEHLQHPTEPLSTCVFLLMGHVMETVLRLGDVT